MSFKEPQLALCAPGFCTVRGSKNSKGIIVRFLKTSTYATSFLIIALTACIPQARAIDFTLLADNLRSPVAITHAGDSRLFITEQAGQIKIIQDGQLLGEPFLNISHLVKSGGERGLLSTAFHPQYTENGFFYVNYTNSSGNTVIARYEVTADPSKADPNSEKVLLQIDQPFSNHNGGQIAFGPDGYLYIGTGDGGRGGDPLNAGQDLSTLLGKILRIDVDKEEPYAIPEDNPFISNENARPEIWAYGLRNPWRFSFDSEADDLFIADVGQNSFEEVNFQPSTSTGGENYGWRLMEAEQCFEPRSNCNAGGTLILPIISYARADGRSITGGYVYRGQAIKSLQGKYVYGDFATKRVWMASRGADKWTAELLANTSFSISSFGEGFAGELYLADHSGGKIYKLTP